MAFTRRASLGSNPRTPPRPQDPYRDPNVFPRDPIWGRDPWVENRWSGLYNCLNAILRGWGGGETGTGDGSWVCSLRFGKRWSSWPGGFKGFSTCGAQPRNTGLNRVNVKITSQARFSRSLLVLRDNSPCPSVVPDGPGRSQLVRSECPKGLRVAGEDFPRRVLQKAAPLLS